MTSTLTVAEMVCPNDHVWVPGTPVLNAGGESGGGVLSEEFCPACGVDRTGGNDGFHVYYDKANAAALEATRFAAQRLAGYGEKDTPCTPGRACYTDDIAGDIAYGRAVGRWETYTALLSRDLDAHADPDPTPPHGTERPSS